MKKRIILLIIIIIMVNVSACKKNETVNISNTNMQTKSSEKLKIIDMSGREVEIPNKITKVYCTGPIATILLYTIDSKLLVGVNYKLSEVERKYLDETFINLPVLGGWYGKGNKGNLEEILKAKPDIIINAGTVNKSAIALSDKIQKQTGIPTLMVDNKINTLEEVYNFLGKILNQVERTNKLKEYISNTLEEIKVKKKIIKDKVNVYYAEGDKGLETDPKGSMHSEILEIIGAKNAADVNMENNGYGRQKISIEQLLEWNPELILVTNNCAVKSTKKSAYEIIKEENIYKTIDAVKHEKIYEIPNKPFNWFDRPPSVNRIIGIKWAANLIYPNIYNYNMAKEIKEFYKLFYRYELTNKEVDKLLYRSRSK